MTATGPSARLKQKTQRNDNAVPMRLIISCADRPGIVFAVSRFLHDNGANIVRSDQYSTDPAGGQFFLRTEFTLPFENRDGFAAQFGLRVAEPLNLTWRIWDAAQPKRLAVLVSRYDHCLHDLLYRWRRDELGGQITAVISNWDDLRSAVASYGVPYHHVPVTKERKAEAEAEILSLLGDDCDVIVLARYMQILSADFLERVDVPVINIHHSFLPAFEGPGPYERAKERGVKLVGATAHYVTAELDAGTDHRAGRRAGPPQRHGRGPHANGSRGGTARPGSRRPMALRRPRHPAWQFDRRLLARTIATPKTCAVVRALRVLKQSRRREAGRRRERAHSQTGQATGHHLRPRGGPQCHRREPPGWQRCRHVRRRRR